MSGATNEGDAPIFLEEYNELYDKFKHLDFIIEGPEFELDYSYFLIHKCSDLMDLERGITLSKLSEEIS